MIHLLDGGSGDFVATFNAKTALAPHHGKEKNVRRR
jgi:hypothetical protein